MGREYVVAWAGRHRRGAWESLCADYRERIARTVPVRDLPVKVRGRPRGVERRRAEGEALLAALPEPCWIVALDPRGEPLSSETLAARLARRRRDWPHPIAFLLGSDLGLGPGVLAAARLVLSFGPVTLSHELARLVLYEQLYRALALESGAPYSRADRS